MNPTFLVIDLFCGAGGTTTGFAMSKEGTAKVIACVNHDPVAIESHWQNHPDVLHFEEDIRTLDLTELVECANHWKSLYPKAKLILWASLECTNFSKAKGGQPRDADSRTLAEHLHRYIDALHPDLVMIENVEEFMSWGPLDENGKPLSRRNGIDYLRWVNSIIDCGYAYDWKMLNSADFGAYTSRSRYFGIFAKPGIPIVFPTPTHTKNPGTANTLFDGLKKWKAVKEVLDFEDEGTSIFGRKKPLSEKTLERVYAGLIKYVAGGEKAFVTKWNGNNAKTGINNGKSVEDPLPVITTQNRLGLVKACFISKYYSGNPEHKNIPVEGPAGTIKTIDGQALVQASFIQQRNGGDPNSKVLSVNQPARTLTQTGGNQELVQPYFLNTYYGNGGVTDIAEPCPTLTTKDRLGLIKPQFWIDKQFTSGGRNQDVDRPAGSLLTVPKLNLVSAHWLDKQYSGKDNHQSVDQPAGSLTANPPFALMDAKFIMPTHYNNKPQSLEEPCSTITANRKWHYLVNPSWHGHASSIHNPSPVLIARQDKAPLYLVASEEGDLMIEIFPDDSPTTIKIKEFMACFGIIDIKMRMLKVPELMRIQGFPPNYKLAGNQTDQKKFIGNSVVPHVVKAWAEALAQRLC